MYFDSCRTAEEGKSLYRELVRRFHPDNGGDAAEMARINDEFRTWWTTHKNMHQTADGKTYQKATTETADEFIDILNKLSKVPGLVIDLCGSWLWIGGSTYLNREYLKECGCQYSSGKKKWFWAFGLDHKKGRGSLTEKEITAKYGRKRVNVQYNPTPCLE